MFNENGHFNRLTVIIATLIIAACAYLSYTDFHGLAKYTLLGICVICEICVLILRWG